MAKRRVVTKKLKHKPETILVQTNLSKTTTLFFDKIAEEKMMSRAEYLRELLEICHQEIMEGKIG